MGEVGIELAATSAKTEDAWIWCDKAPQQQLQAEPEEPCKAHHGPAARFKRKAWRWSIIGIFNVVVIQLELARMGQQLAGPMAGAWMG